MRLGLGDGDGYFEGEHRLQLHVQPYEKDH